MVVEFKCRKCGTVVSHEEYNKSRFCPNCGTFLSSGKSSLSTSSGLTHAEMIADVIKDLQEPFTRQQVIKAVVEKYSSVRLIDKESLGTDIAGCCINLKSHDSLPNLPFLLVAVGRGLYRRYEPRKDNSQVIDYANLKTPTISRTERVQGELIQDVEKAKEIGAVLHTQFSTKTGFFKNYEMPEYVLPNNIEEGSLEHARYLTFIISIDYQTDAAELWRNARSTYLIHPEYFDPKNLVNMDLDSLSKILKDLGARYPTNGAKAWKTISSILLKKYGGDPRRLTPTSISVSEIKRLIDLFPYLRGKKLSNFYIRAMGEKNLFQLTNLDDLDIPVDVQVARLTFYSGCLRVENGSLDGCIHEPPIQPAIEEVWRKAAKMLDIAPWKLDEPIWTIGSKLCSPKFCTPCPIKDLCNKNFNAVIKGNKIHWT